MSKGGIEGVGGDPHFTATDVAGSVLEDKRWVGRDAEFDAMLGALLAWAEAHVHPDTLAAVGHRVVHGGRTRRRRGPWCASGCVGWGWSWTPPQTQVGRLGSARRAVASRSA